MRVATLPFLLLVALVFAPLGGTLFAEDEPAPAPKPKEGDTADDADKPKTASPEERKRIQELVTELSAITSEIRGLAWKKPVVADLLTRDEMMAYMKKSVKDEVDPEEIERAHLIMRRLGMLGPDQDIVEMTLDMLTGVAGGFFNPKTKKIYMLAGQDPDSQRPTIVHELCHALEDQYIDLEKTQEALSEDSDGMFAFKCLIEGSAEIVRGLYEDRKPEAARKQLAGQMGNQELREGQKRTFKTTPAFMLLNTLLHYRTGPNFVRKAVGTDYREQIDALFKDRPTTQEQVLHPERWVGDKRDYPVQIAWKKDLAKAFGEGWSQMEDMVQGELDLALWMDFYLGPDDGKLSPKDMQSGSFVAPLARTAAEGWDGGRMIFLQGPKKNIVVSLAVAYDTAKDAAEGFDGLQQTVTRMYADEFTPGATTEGTEAGRKHFDYVGAYGDGRILLDGSHILWLDGVEGAEMNAFWPHILATTFVADERDTWAATDDVDIFKDCELVLRGRGLGLDVPEGWELAEERSAQARAQDPAMLTIATHEDSNGAKVMTVLRVMNQGLAKGVMSDILKQQLGGQVPFAPERLADATASGWSGVSYDALPSGAPMAIRIVLVSNGLQSMFAMTRGPASAVTELEDEIQALLDGLRIKLGY